MVWAVNQQIARGKRTRIWGGALLCLLFLMLATPKIPRSSKNHIFADMRNFLGNQTLHLTIRIYVYVICVLFDSFLSGFWQECLTRWMWLQISHFWLWVFWVLFSHSKEIFLTSGCDLLFDHFYWYALGFESLWVLFENGFGVVFQERFGVGHYSMLE